MREIKRTVLNLSQVRKYCRFLLLFPQPFLFFHAISRSKPSPPSSLLLECQRERERERRKEGHCLPWLMIASISAQPKNPPPPPLKGEGEEEEERWPKERKEEEKMKGFLSLSLPPTLNGSKVSYNTRTCNLHHNWIRAYCLAIKQKK